MKAAASFIALLFLVDKTPMHCHVPLKAKASAGGVTPAAKAEVRGIERKKHDSKENRRMTCSTEKNKLKPVLTSGFFSLTSHSKRSYYGKEL